MQATNRKSIDNRFLNFYKIFKNFTLLPINIMTFQYAITLKIFPLWCFLLLSTKTGLNLSAIKLTT